MPAAMDMLAARQCPDLVLEVFIVITDDPGLDEGAPVPGDVDAVENQFLVGLQIFRPDQGFFVYRHRRLAYCTLGVASRT